MKEISEMLSIIGQMKERGVIKAYIDYIKFPFYRNLEINTEIHFDFPLTIFIGQNGCGKSSCLHSLYGAPENYTPYSFWFDTKVDPVEYYDDSKKRHSFWYKYKDASDIEREVIKARIRRNNNPNYWETSRPLRWAGMRTRERNDRDSPIPKNVVYLDFRSELSAFDKFFYFGNVRSLRSQNKQEFIRKKSGSLKKIFDEETQYIRSKNGNLNKPLEIVTKDIVEKISFILGKDYSEILSVYHRLFRSEGYSVLFKCDDDVKYSEAFAGSGEIAVYRLVSEILNAPPYSLILLDEPEVSLHPGAQSRLKIFLLDQIIQKKHQIILCTHSPIIAGGMPSSAIKVFFKNINNGRFIVKENITAEEAFYFIEHPFKDRKNIIVEDILAKYILDKLLADIGAETQNLFDIKYNPGGVQVIKKEFIPVFCREEGSREFIFLDGDQKIIDHHYDWRTFPSSDVTVHFLSSKIQEMTNVDINFSVDGGTSGGREDQKVELLKKYLDYYKDHVFYLPGNTPEEIIWNDDFAYSLLKNAILIPDKCDNYIRELNSINNLKEKFSFLTFALISENDAESILNIQKQFIQRWINGEDLNYQILRDNIETLKNV